ncbi:MAG TPA: TPM domain-containing protein [Syntrophomonadaceae bacterium]|nr:TPM domain-containing protein [Syntrophomonadaceae bacterium]
MAFLSFAFFPSPIAAALSIPDPGPGFYVLDQANVMSDQTKSLIINTSQELRRSTKAQVAVVTLKSLEDQPISAVSLAIARKWQLGDKSLNNGLLILVVPSGTPGNMSRIEVGYGLEGALPDAKTGRIQDQYMIPAFRNGNFDQGLRDGYIAVINEIAHEYGVTITPGQTNSTANKAPAKTKLPTWAVILGVLILLILLWLDNHFLNGFLTGLLLGMLLRGGFGGGRGGGSDSGGGGGFGGGGSDR